MKKLFILFSIIFSITCYSQAHLGHTYNELERFVGNRPIKTGFLKNGYWYAETNYDLGKFVYCFSNDGYIVFCFQIPYNQGCVNAQAEIYNQKYSIISSNSWVAYLDGGGIMYINLVYDDGLEQFVFNYNQ